MISEMRAGTIKVWKMVSATKRNLVDSRASALP